MMLPLKIPRFIATSNQNILSIRKFVIMGLPPFIGYLPSDFTEHSLDTHNQYISPCLTVTFSTLTSRLISYNLSLATPGRRPNQTVQTIYPKLLKPSTQPQSDLEWKTKIPSSQSKYLPLMKTPPPLPKKSPEISNQKRVFRR